MYLEDFQWSYKQAETSFWCTNISDMFHLSALWFCFCVLQQKTYITTKDKNCQYNLPSYCSFALYCLNPLYCLSDTSGCFTTNP